MTFDLSHRCDVLLKKSYQFIIVSLSSLCLYILRFVVIGHAYFLRVLTPFEGRLHCVAQDDGISLQWLLLFLLAILHLSHFVYTDSNFRDAVDVMGKGLANDRRVVFSSVILSHLYQ